jgi:pescadillo protein
MTTPRLISEDEDAPKKTKKRKPSRLTHEMAMREKDIIINKRIKDMGEDGEIDAMRYVMLPRKKRELYKAMQLGLAKKEARTNELKERAAKLKKEGVMDDKGRLVENKEEKKGPKEEKKAPAKKKAKK